MSELQILQSEIAPEIAGKLRLKFVGEDRKRLAKRYTENSAAYALYLQAAHSRKSTERVSYLQRSIANDPSFALDYVQLAISMPGRQPPEP